MHLRRDSRYYESRKPSPELKTWKNLKNFIWDSQKRAFLQRTAREWKNVCLFYLFFYGVLFSTFWLLMSTTMSYVRSLDRPPHFLMKSDGKIGSLFEPSLVGQRGPGIAFKPKLDSRVLPPRITVDLEPNRYVEAIGEHLKTYQVNKTLYDATCSYKHLREDNGAKPCLFDIELLGECSKPPYGYTPTNSQPCVYIQFNKRIEWVPIFFSQASYLPVEMPKWLQKIVRDTEEFYVWLSCEGMSDEDANNLGELEYLPQPGFPVYFFPFMGQVNYLSPIVALKFKNLTADKVVSIECKTWARNIDNENRYNLNFQIEIRSSRI